MGRDALIRYRAERLLREDFSGLRARVAAIVRSRLRSRGVKLDPSDLDACYAQAWHGLYSCLLDGEQIEDVAAWLVVVTYRRALDELRARARQGRACEAGGQTAYSPAEEPSGGFDLAGKLDDRARIRHVLEALNGALSPRERQAAALCYLQGLSRSHAARRMGMSEVRMRKLMDGSPGKPGVAAKVSALVGTIEEGRWCEQQGSLMRAYAFGILDPQGERHALALAHLRECSACRAFVLSLRGLAAVLPPLLPLPLPPSPLSPPGDSNAARPRARRPRARAPRARASVRMSGLRAAFHGARVPLAKLALVVTAALGVGGGAVVLARVASRPLHSSPSAPRAAVRLVRSASVPPRAQRTPHRQQPPMRRRRSAPRHTPTVVSQSLPPAPALATVAPSVRRSAPEMRARSEEFGPERASSRGG